MPFADDIARDTFRNFGVSESTTNRIIGYVSIDDYLQEQRDSALTEQDSRMLDYVGSYVEVLEAAAIGAGTALGGPAGGIIGATIAEVAFAAVTGIARLTS